MAEPLSLIGSIIAVGQATQAAKSGISKIRVFFSASDELQLLLNEIESIRLVVACYEEELRLQQEIGLVRSEAQEGLVNLLGDVKRSLLEIDQLAQFKLVDSINDDGEVKARRRAFAWRERKILASRERLRDMKLSLVALLGVVTLGEIRRFGLSIQDTLMIMRRETGASTPYATRGERLLDQHAMMIQSVSDSTAASESLPPRPLDQPTEIMPARSARSSTSSGESLASTLTVKCAIYRENSLSCTGWCSCACHRRVESRMPLFGTLGTIMVGFTGLPFLAQGCSEKSCLKRTRFSGSFTFHLPIRLLGRVLRAKMLLTWQPGPELVIRVPRIIPSKSDIFHFIETNNELGLVRLLRSNKASVDDVSETGSSVLHFALNSSRYGICRLLLDSKADMMIEGPQNRRPIDIAWDTILGQFETGENAETLADMFKNDEHLDSRAFTILHKCVLKLLPLDLEQQLRASTENIDAVDAEGRTPLVWASIRGDESALQKLLDYKASTNIEDKAKKTALHHARNTACVEILLRAKPNVDQLDTYGRTALHAACRRRGGDPERISRLLRAGADPNIGDNWQRTPLSYLAQFNDIEGLKVLLHASFLPVTTDCIDIDGYTPLLTAVESNSHEVLRYMLKTLLTWGFERVTIRAATVLHVAARSADGTALDTLMSLARPELEPINVNAVDIEGCTALDLLEQRIGDQLGSGDTLRAFLIRASNEAPESDDEQYYDAHEGLDNLDS